MDYVDQEDLKRTFSRYLRDCDEDELSYDVIEEILQDAINDSDYLEVDDE